MLSAPLGITPAPISKIDLSVQNFQTILFWVNGDLFEAFFHTADDVCDEFTGELKIFCGTLFVDAAFYEFLISNHAGFFKPVAF